MSNPRRRQLSVGLGLVVFALAFGPGGGHAHANWNAAVRDYEQALRSYDVVRWDRALRALGRQDHPAALAWVARFHETQRRFTGTWQNDNGNPARRVLRKDLHGLYVPLLAGKENVRSLRFLVEGLRDADEARADLFARALATSPSLHLVEDVLRERLPKLLRKRALAAARRHLELLKDRLHVGDAPWVEKLARDRRTDADLRLDLIRACPDHELGRRLLARNADRAFVDAAALEATVRGWLDAAAGESARAALDRAAREADRIEAWLTTDTASPPDPVRRLKEIVPAATAPGLEALTQRRARALLAAPEVAGLFDLHAAFVQVRHARAMRRDVYLRPKGQRQRFDRRIDEARVTAKAPVLDLEAVAVRDHVAVLRAIAACRGAVSGEPHLALPYADDLLALNAGRRRTVHDVAFTRAERQRHELIHTVRDFNRAEPGVSAAERENVRIVNAYRLTYDLLPLRIDPDLTESARLHSEFQREVGEIAHTFKTRKEPHGQTPFERMRRAGYPHKYVGGENVLSGLFDPQKAFDSWRTSSGHRRNMLTPAWTEIGVGKSGSYWTQNFGREPYDQDHHARRTRSRRPAAAVARDRRTGHGRTSGRLRATPRSPM